MEAFFSHYPDFKYRAHDSSGQPVDANEEFRRLTEHRNWVVGSARYKKALKGFREAKILASSGSTPDTAPPATAHAKLGPNALGSKKAKKDKGKQGQQSSSSSSSSTSAKPNASTTTPATHGPAQPPSSTSTAPNNPTSAVQAAGRIRMKPVKTSIQVILEGPGDDAAFQGPTPMDMFFARWPDFNYNPKAHPINEYERMSLVLKWDTPTYFLHYAPFYAATRDEFREQIFRPRELVVKKRVMTAMGSPPVKMEAVFERSEDNVNDLALKAYNRLCLILGRDKADTKKLAEKNLECINVNIFDLIYHLRNNTTHHLQRYGTVRELARYSYQHGIVYPWEEAGHNTISEVLTFLLRSLRPYKVKRKGRPRGCPDPDFDRRL